MPVKHTPERPTGYVVTADDWNAAHTLPSIDELEGIITDVQHGDKTSIPNAHHTEDHAPRHHSGGADPLALANIEGIITDAQHGNKLTIPDAHFRKWAWADESTHSSYVPIPLGLPIKYAGNPILSPRADKWDNTHLLYPHVKRYGSYTYLFYVHNWLDIGIARSTGFYDFERFDEPIIVHQAGYYDSVNIGSPNVIIDEVAGLWKCYYVGYNGTSWSLLLATCPLTSDPTVPANWTKSASNPLTHPNPVASSEGTLKLGNLYWMLYASSPETNLLGSRSLNGLTFVNEGTLLSIGASGAWDDVYVMFATVFWNLGIYYILYSGYDGGYWRIGIAYNWIRWGTFTKELINPVIDLGEWLTWDGHDVRCPSIIMFDGKFYIYYNGRNNAPWQIGVATIP